MGKGVTPARRRGAARRREHTPWVKPDRIPDALPQHTTGTGTGKRKTGKKKRPYRDDDSEPPTKRRLVHDLSPESKHRLVADYRVAKALKSAGAKAPSVKRLAEAAGVERHLPSALLKKDEERGSLKRKIGSGRLPSHGPEDVEAMYDYLRSKRYRSSYDKMEQ